jgi:tetratricopeptide (TPR) repeat protein
MSRIQVARDRRASFGGLTRYPIAEDTLPSELTCSSKTMKRKLLLVTVCLLILQAGCWRKKSTANTNSVVGSTLTPSAEEKRSQARLYLETGKQAYRDDQDSKAAEAFEQALKLDPDLAEAHFRLGLALDVLKKEKEAEESYRRAVESYKKYFANEENEQDAEGHYNLGQTYAGLHLYSEAVREYRQATRFKPDDADIYYDLGMALTRLAHYDEAVAAFSKSVEIDPENYRAEDALADAREGVNRIRAGKKHQEELLKKQKEEELEKQQETGATPATPEKKPTKP